MPDSTRTTPEDLHSKAGKRARDEDLAALLVDWDEAPAPSSPKLLWVLTLVLTIGAIWVMSATFKVVQWNWQSESPTEIGDLRGLKLSGEPLVVRDNQHARMTGLVPSRIQALAKGNVVHEGESPEGLSFLFYCPLYQIVVWTPQDLRLLQPNPESLKRSEGLVDGLSIFPEDLSLEISAQGRLRRADLAPEELRPFIDQYARRMALPVEALWVLLDEQRPTSSVWGTLVWAASLVPALVALAFTLLSMRQGRRFTRSHP